MKRSFIIVFLLLIKQINFAQPVANANYKQFHKRTTKAAERLKAIILLIELNKVTPYPMRIYTLIGVKPTKQLKRPTGLENFNYLLPLAKRINRGLSALQDVIQVAAVTASIADLQKKGRILKNETTVKLTESSYTVQESAERMERKEYRITEYIYLSILLGTLSGAFALLSYKIWALNKKLKSQNIILHEHNQFRNFILKVIGHDLSGILSAMGSVLYIVERKNSAPDPDLKTLRMIRQEAFELFNSLMIWGDGDVQNPGNRKNLNIKSILKDEMKSISMMAELYNVKVKIDLEDVDIYFNEQHFRFIFRTLALNSIKYAIPNEIVSIRVAKSATGTVLILRTKSEANNVSRLRSVFDSVSSKKLEQTNGAGLALRLSLNLAKINDASIHLESEKEWIEITMQPAPN